MLRLGRAGSSVSFFTFDVMANQYLLELQAWSFQTIAQRLGGFGQSEVTFHSLGPDLYTSVTRCNV